MNTSTTHQEYKDFLDSVLNLTSSNWSLVHEEIIDEMSTKVFKCSINGIAIEVAQSPVGLILGRDVTDEFSSFIVPVADLDTPSPLEANLNTSSDEDFFSNSEGNNNNSNNNNSNNNNSEQDDFDEFESENNQNFFGDESEDEFENQEDNDYEEQTPPPPPPYVAPLIVGTIKEEKKVDKVYDLMMKYFVNTSWKSVLTEPLSVKYDSGVRRKIPNGLAKISSSFTSYSLLTKHEKTLLLQKMKSKDIDLLMSVSQRIYESIVCLDTVKWRDRSEHIAANYGENDKTVGFKQSVKMVEQILDSHIQSTHPISPAAAALIRKIKILAHNTVKNSIQSSDNANDFAYITNSTLAMDWTNFPIDTYSPPKDPKNKAPDNTMNEAAPVIKKSYKL